jgi:fructokinase
MISVTALGEVLIDFTDAGISDSGQRLFERNPGGAPANVLVALERLGIKTAFIGKVGDDIHGSFLRKTLISNGVNCDGLIVDKKYFTTLAFVELNEQGDRSFSFARKPGADTQLRRDELNETIIQDSHIFHIGSLSLTNEPAHSATLAALDIAKETGCVLSYDPNYRANLWPNVETAIAQMRSVLPWMDLVKISDAECGLLTDYRDPERASDAIIESGAAICAVTLGKRGSYVRTADGASVIPSFSTNAVDTTGAGDSFWGGFLYEFLKSSLSPSNVSLDEAKIMARTGNAVASLCVQKRGGIPSMPSREEVEDLLSKR